MAPNLMTAQKVWYSTYILHSLQDGDRHKNNFSSFCFQIAIVTIIIIYKSYFKKNEVLTYIFSHSFYLRGDAHGTAYLFSVSVVNDRFRSQMQVVDCRMSAQVGNCQSSLSVPVDGCRLSHDDCRISVAEYRFEKIFVGAQLWLIEMKRVKFSIASPQTLNCYKRCFHLPLRISLWVFRKQILQ